MLLDEKAALWLLGGLCDAFRVPLDRNVLLTAAELPYSEQKLFQVGRRLGFRFDFTVIAVEHPPALALPCLLFLKTGPGESAWATPVLAMGEDERNLLYFVEGATLPCRIAVERLSDVFGPFAAMVSLDVGGDSGAAVDAAN